MVQEITVLILVKMVITEEVVVVDLQEMEQEDLLVLVINIIMRIFNHLVIMAEMEVLAEVLSGHLEVVEVREVLVLIFQIQQAEVMEDKEKTLYHILGQM